MKTPFKKKAVKKKAKAVAKKARSAKVSNTAEFWEAIANDTNKSNAQRNRASDMAKSKK